MNRFITLCTVLLLLFAGQVASADYGFYGGFPTGRFKPLEVSKSKDRAVYESALRYRIMVSKANQQNNHFCLIGYHWVERKDDVMLIWYEGRQLYFLWRLNDYDPQFLYRSLLDTPSIRWEPSWTYLQGRAHDWNILASEYDPNEYDINNEIFYNNYDTKEDYLLMQLDCERNGEMLTIPAFSRPKNCDKDDVPPYDTPERQLCDAMK